MKSTSILTLENHEECSFEGRSNWMKLKKKQAQQWVFCLFMFTRNFCRNRNCEQTILLMKKKSFYSGLCISKIITCSKETYSVITVHTPFGCLHAWRQPRQYSAQILLAFQAMSTFSIANFPLHTQRVSTSDGRKIHPSIHPSNYLSIYLYNLNTLTLTKNV